MFATLLLEMIVILCACRFMGWVCGRIRQPPVVGEMLAGLLLGPSLAGRMAPEAFARLFPAQSLGPLSMLSQFGLILYMFLVGLKMDFAKLRAHRRAAVLASLSGIALPFALGATLAVGLLRPLAPPGVPGTSFTMFLGVAMSVTAFPVLARIVTDSGLLGTSVGTIAIASAAVDDVTAWTLLAATLAVARPAAQGHPVWLTFAMLAAYVLVMLMVESVLRRRPLTGPPSAAGFAALILLLLVSAWTTEMIGVHALFGAFAAGAALPKQSRFVEGLTERIEPVTVTVLLPLFFAVTGLRTSIALISGVGMWASCGAIIAMAVAGKWGGAMIASRIMGMRWREAAAVGILMNTRGLVELVVLNIGLELGILSPILFSMMVLMALSTTFMAPPLLHWVYPPKSR